MGLFEAETLMFELCDSSETFTESYPRAIQLSVVKTLESSGWGKYYLNNNIQCANIRLRVNVLIFDLFKWSELKSLAIRLVYLLYSLDR